MAKKKTWSAALKFEITLLAIKGEVTLNEIYKRYQVAPSLVHKWKAQFLEQGEQLFDKADKSKEEIIANNERVQGKLYEKIGQLTVERDFLKKSWNRFHGGQRQRLINPKGTVAKIFNSQKKYQSKPLRCYADIPNKLLIN